MAIWKCQECGNISENRCKPGKCKVCGAVKDKLVKEEQEKGRYFSGKPKVNIQ